MARLRSSTLLAAIALTSAGCKPEPPTEPSTVGQEAAPQEAQAGPAYAYPTPRRSDHVDDYHGTKVSDPYRWMEDLDSDELRGWIEEENALTFGVLDGISDRARIKARLEKLWDYERFGTPYELGGRYFLTRNDGLQDQSVLYWMDSLDGEMHPLLDPHGWSSDGTVALSGTSVSEDGKYIAYAKSASGSDWKEWFVKEVETGKDLSDHIEWTKFTGVSWTKDGKGFYYGGFEAPKKGDEFESTNYFQKLYYHRLGDPQSEDTLVYERPDQKEWQFSGDVTEDGRYLVIDVSVGTDRRNRVYVRDLKKKKGKIIELLDAFDASYSYVGNDKTTFWFKTDKDAPKGRLVAINLKKPDPKDWKVVIPEGEHKLNGVSQTGDQFIANYLADASTRIEVFDLKGKPIRNVELPGIGSAGGFWGKRDAKETFYSFRSFTRPSTIYRYDLASGKSTVFKAPKLAFNPDDYVTEQVFYSSLDGTRVPMFITHKKGVKAGEGAPTYLYGYGGFNISLTPSFSVPNLVWMEMGGVYVQANMRGGGEYGETWHEAGTKLKKQNVFDDFIAAAETLIDKGWTTKEQLVIGGRSNGGLLMGAMLTQRPDLWGCVLAGVGVMDMLRFHEFTIGWAWVSDYGSSADPEQFKALRAYSPVHNVKEGAAYPPTMIYTADHDDRVVPSHSFKFAAEMQHAQGGDAPVLIRIDTKAGHGAGKPTSKRIEEWMDLWGFAAHSIGMELPEGF